MNFHAELRVRSYVIWLSKIIEVAGKNLNEFTKDDIRKVLAHYQTLVNQGKYTNSTIFEVRKTLKKFFRWLGMEELVNWFSVGDAKLETVHPDEIYFPLYDEGEIRDILRWRVERGFYSGAMSDDAFDRIVELTAKHGDLRFGLYVLRMAGISAERRASRKVEVEDVENVYKGGLKVFVAKSISALNSDEREVLKTIYLINEDISSGDLYAIIYNEVKMSYTRFYEILEKLERLRLIDVVMGSKKKRGRTRYVIKRFERDVILDALKEF